MTNREFFEVIGNVFEGIENEHKEDVLAFVEKQIKAIDAKNEKAKQRAAEKRANGDALKEAIYQLLGEEPMVVEEILNALGEEHEGLTPAKVVARMTQLVKEGRVEKEAVKVEGRKLVAYKLAEAE